MPLAWGPGAPSSFPSLRPRARTSLLLVGVVGCFALGVVAVAFAPADSDVASWWPAAGVATGVLLLGRRWTALVGAIGLATTAANLVAGRELPVAVAFGVANAAEALLVAWILTRGRREPARLEDLHDALRLLVATAAGAVLLGGLAGLIVRFLLDGPFVATVRSTMASHSASQLVLLPVLLLLPTVAARVRTAPGSLPEGVAQCGLLAVSVGVVFAPGQTWPTAFTVFPLLAWAALRLPPVVAAVEVLGCAVAVSVLTAEGAGPFGAELVRGSSPAEVGALVQAFLTAMALVALPLALSADQRRRSAAALADQSRLTDAVLDSEAAQVVVLDGELRVERANAAAVAAAGEGCRPGRSLWECGLLGRTVEETRDLLERCCGAPGGLEHTTRDAGTFRTVLWSGRRMVVPGRGVGYVLTGLDVTGHRTSQSFLGQVLEATRGTLLAGVDTGGRVTYWNAGAQHLLGHRAETVIGRPLADLVVPLPAGGPRPAGASPHSFEADRLGPEGRVDWQMLAADGTTRVVSVTVDVMTAPDGQPMGYVAVGKDVSGRRLEEQRLAAALERERQSTERLAEVSAIKSDLIASVSHELRTPLTNVLGFAELLVRDDALDAPHRHWVERIRQNGLDLRSLIEDLLLMSRVESEAPAAAHGSVDLTSLVERVVARARQQVVEDCRVAGRAVSAVVAVSRTAGPLPVLGDATQLERALWNVVTNAVKYSPEGGVVDVRCERVGDEVVVTVRDQGIGMAPGELERAFEPFFRGHRARESGIGGSGLGLGIVRSVVEAHGGRAAAAARPGGGLVVTLGLPAAWVREASQEERRRSDTATASSRAVALNGLTR
ncbi:hypothetical protein GCM10009737_14650 [Nocardioides lentus]|uniref:Sensor-like histidine kinase SenX3 n=1 Tax=Nocardioides lentus TaxID=338077 RepID=A0ABP5AJI9_9ACTN